MSEEGFFSKYISQPVKKFYNYITGKTEESDNVQSTADDLQSTANDVHNIVQENSESLDTHVQSNENDII
ncbi:MULTISPECIES: hypothetical protein [unclassified Wolbachia]|uniref:hypothetical protein n=1 Tax=unclassified Wolbachia TaxID=2640676 RepID=UPI00202590C9|nr:hypothetical protein [Wolbachia endosymbiont of Oedothorax gibbosus]